MRTQSVDRKMNGMNRFAFFALALSLVHCGGSVATSPGEPSVTKPTETPTPWVESACATVKASCTSAPAMYVVGHATGLVGLDGARAEFAVRYLTEDGAGLDVPHGVAVGRTYVKDGGFETCACVPTGANMYPELAAVVYAPKTTSETGKDVARATYSQRYATLGDEDFTYALGAVPTDAQKETAVAAMIERATAVTLRGIDATGGARVTAGLVADDRPIAPQLASAAIESGSDLRFSWTMPGRSTASERVAFFVDRDANGLCDPATDAGGFRPFASVIDASGPLLVGADLKAICDALQPDVPRE